jgi:hypothetical protein
MGKATSVRISLGLLALAAPLFVSSVAFAQPSASELSLAQSLFEEGRKLMDKGQFAAACPKLAESQRLDPGGGTLLNLAICHEKEGKIGTAYLEFQAAQAQAIKDGRKDREKISGEHMGAISPRLSKLAVHVVKEVPDIDVRVDGTTLRKPAWDVSTVFDPGTHVIDASAPGHVTYKKSITLNEGEQKTENIPALAALAATAVTPATVVPSTAAAPTMAPTSTHEEDKPKFKMENNGWFVGSVVALSVGALAFLITGPIVLAFAMTSDSCETLRTTDSGPLCPSDGVQNAWTGVMVGSIVVAVAGGVGMAVFPQKVKVPIEKTARIKLIPGGFVF